MKQTDTESDRDPAPRALRPWVRRNALGWVWLVFLLVGTLAISTYGAIYESLSSSIACDSCQDHGDTPHLRLMLVLVACAVPVTLLATAVGMVLPRGGFRVGCAGSVLLVLLLPLAISQF
ncbi:hypothetical protein RKE29_05450 [Streptomyces sp. B1866]|uniref:hypothetical protein n=1 Tax=Streptomyces sp. B1866 TaxID=3075431 RepID=UPI00288D28E1|nr:hypothetical protein [Streptomyces sp. B1866]MDT3396092.1 hypothetical protein [Streptomyces sp. B1866]